jgi:uncharacterized RDD family membrane protein YckC
MLMRRYKTIIQRLAALIIDGIIFLPVSFLEDHFTATSDKFGFLLWNLFFTGIWISYSVLMHGRYGQTLGKMASNVKVFSLDEKHLIGYKRAFYRESLRVTVISCGVLYLLITNPNSSGITDVSKSGYESFLLYGFCVVALAEFITVFSNSKRRAVHDFIAGSVVLDTTTYRKWDFEYTGNTND